MSSRNLLFRNIKAQARINTGTMPNNGHFVKPESQQTVKPKGPKGSKDTGSTIDNIEPIVTEIVNQTEVTEVIQDAIADVGIVNDDVNQDTIVNDDDAVIE